MDDIKQLHCASRFVRLKMSDQMPLGILASDLDDLAFRFLDFVLAENGYAGGDRIQNYRRRMRLANRNELDLISISARSRSGVAYLGTDGFQISSKIGLHRSNIANASRILEFQGSN